MAEQHKRGALDRALIFSANRALRCGELWFAAHARHADAEMRALADQVTARLANSPQAGHLRQLLQALPTQAR
jgi:hypothetical protein